MKQLVVIIYLFVCAGIALAENQVAGGANSSISAIDLDSGREIYSSGAATALKPASVMKIATSVAAMKILGPDYRYRTQLLSTGIKPGGLIQELYVRGAADPSLTVESVWLMVRKLKKLGVRRIGKLVIDDTLFNYDKPPVGGRAYQTGSSALSLNFNSLAFDVCPASSGLPANVVADPWEANVKLTGQIISSNRRNGFSIDEDLNDNNPNQLTFKIQGNVRTGGGCTTVYHSVKNPPHYFGATLYGLLQSNGIEVLSKVRFEPIPAIGRPLFYHESKPLSDIIWALNHYSTNFIADQLVLTLGRLGNGRFDRNLGIRRITDYVRSLGFDESEFYMDDGSGLSRLNRVSARVLAKILADAFHDESIRPDFEVSLPYPGREGTLKRRPFKFVGHNLRAKTGTIDGVSSLAGYAYGPNGRKIAFAIINNKLRSVADAHRIQYSLVKSWLSKDN